MLDQKLAGGVVTNLEYLLFSVMSQRADLQNLKLVTGKKAKGRLFILTGALNGKILLLEKPGEVILDLYFSPTHLLTFLSQVSERRLQNRSLRPQGHDQRHRAHL